jgi:hypothetical protein
MPVFGDDLFVYTNLFITGNTVNYYHLDAQLYAKLHLDNGRFEVYDERNDKRIEDFLLSSVSDIPVMASERNAFGDDVFFYGNRYIENSEMVYKVGQVEIILNLEEGTLSVYERNILRMKTYLTKKESSVDGSNSESQESTTNDQTSHR